MTRSTFYARHRVRLKIYIYFKLKIENNRGNFVSISGERFFFFKEICVIKMRFRTVKNVGVAKKKTAR